MKPLSRRDFLKLGGLALGGLAFSPHLSKATEFEDIDLVRVATTSVSVYAEPSDQYRITGTWFRDDIVHAYEEIVAETPAWNPVWYRVWGGYMHRARLQKVKVRYNQPLSAVPETGMLAEVTVPYAQAYRHDTLNGWQTTYRLYYSSVHWITGIETGPDNQPWYRILDEADESLYFVPAVQMRPIPAEEITPLSPDVTLQVKRIEVSLDTQILTCYENDKVVKRTEISSGLSGLSGPDGEPTNTPVGRFNVQVKMPSKHMGEANLAAEVEDYVLVGVPWCTFFEEQDHQFRGLAFHGTYWHDNFGVPMSHGCINLRTEEAKWLFRWTMPTAGFDEIDPGTLDRKGFGTAIKIY